MERPKRYFIASGCPIVTTTLYRCIHLREQLQDLGHEAEVALWFLDEQIDPWAASDCDAMVLYRLAMSPPLREFIERARAKGKTIIFDTDDLIFEPDLIELHRGVRNLSKPDQEQHAEGVRRYLETLQASDVVMTATPLLAELARKRNRPAFVHRNSLGREMLAVADSLYEKRRSRTGNRIVIGYGSGTPTHDVDFLEAAAPLAQVLDRFPQLDLWIAGPLVLPPEFTRFGERVRRFPLTDWREWFELMSQIDIAISPLERDNIFCRAKSEIKFVEAGALGIPLVASDTDPFRDAIGHGADGFLALNDKEWIDAFTRLIEQPALRKKMGEAARSAVLHRYSPAARAANLSTLLPELFNSITTNAK
jgi:glycosyltransferase involved in cell wall biosynthesis